MFCDLNHEHEFDKLTEQGNVFLIYKFNPSGCRISQRTIKEVEAVIQKHDLHNAYLIDVKVDRDLSHYVAEQTGIKHESPQLLICKGDSVVDYNSHMDITQAWIEEVISQN